MIDLEFYKFLENNKNQVWFSSYMKCLKENETNCKKYKKEIDNYIYKSLATEWKENYAYVVEPNIVDNNKPCEYPFVVCKYLTEKEND